MAIARKKNDAKKADAAEVSYNVEVLRAKDTGKDIAVDMEVNGVKVYGCWYRTYEDREHPGDEKSFIAFPSRKGTDGKWYQYAWFPINDELLADIEKKIEAKLAEK